MSCAGLLVLHSSEESTRAESKAMAAPWALSSVSSQDASSSFSLHGLGLGG